MSNSNFNPHQPNYFCILTHEIMFCDAIEQGTKLLFAFITSLTYSCGYCFASDEYFAQKFKCDDSTIKRWLKSLEDERFITRETKKNGLKWDRKIFIFKNNFTKPQKCTVEETIVENASTDDFERRLENKTFEDSKMSPYKERDINKDIKTPPPHTPPIENGGGGAQFEISEDLKVINPKGEEVHVSGTQIFQHFLSFGYSALIIKEAIRIAKNDPNPITSPLKYLERVCERLSQSSKNKNLKKEIVDKNSGIPPKCTSKGVNFYGEPA